jgi:putative flippase GtrA
VYKFSVVGLSGVATNMLSTLVLKEIFHLEKYIANTVGFTLGITLNYIINRIWTFESSRPIKNEITKFYLIAGIGITLNHLIVYLTHEQLIMNFYLAKVVAVCGIFSWNFIMHSRYTFRNQY